MLDINWLEWIYDPHAWVTLVTLSFLEIILGIDNVIFITIMVAKMPKARQKITRQFGLMLAMVTRILLLLTITWVMGLVEPLFTLGDFQMTGRDLILIGGGLFLVYKSIAEIIEELKPEEPSVSETSTSGALMQRGMMLIVLQIALIDIVFSLDSVVTAVGLANHIPVMVLAIMIAVAVMLFALKPIGDFVERYPSMKMLALAFLFLVGAVLVIDGFGFHISKGYLYFAMAFSLAVEVLNIRRRGKARTLPHA